MLRTLALSLLSLTLSSGSEPRYQLELNSQRLPIRPELTGFCRRTDSDGDFFLSDDELKADFCPAGGRVLTEWKHAFTGTRLAETALYPDYSQLLSQLQALQAAHSRQAWLVSLGKSHEGRDIWALKLGREAPGRPAVVLTGGTHAREWSSLLVPLKVAERLLAEPARLEKADVWVVPLVNPDGYEFSRQHDNSYRKNRRPGQGVDLNRNYWTPEHPTLYRDEGDRGETSRDDVGASDRPHSDLYRGPSGASEPEIRAVQSLVTRPEVLGVLDNHGYGNMVLHPNRAPRELYAALGAAINAAAGGGFKFGSGADLYAMTGNSMDFHHARGVWGITLEVGRSFQPPAAELEQLLREAVPANLAFIEQVVRQGPMVRREPSEATR